jgi:hypothetical protein
VMIEDFSDTDMSLENGDGSFADSYDALGPDGLTDLFEPDGTDIINVFEEGAGWAVGSTDDAKHWELQSTPFTCAVEAQRGIIETYTGQEISEAQLVYDATSMGHLSDQGMSPADIGSLLEHYGVPCHQVENAQIGDIVSELAAGHKVIIGVDSGELWGEESPMSDFYEQAPDHAIWVTAVRDDGDGNVTVVVNDSGDPDGAGKEYPLDTFVDAWEDSGGFYVATDSPPENLSAQVEGFDPETGMFSSLKDALIEKGVELASPLNTEAGTSALDSTVDIVGDGITTGVSSFVKTLFATGSLEVAGAVGIASGLNAAHQVFVEECQSDNFMENLSEVGRELMFEIL